MLAGGFSRNCGYSLGKFVRSICTQNTATHYKGSHSLAKSCVEFLVLLVRCVCFLVIVSMYLIDLEAACIPTHRGGHCAASEAQA